MEHTCNTQQPHTCISDTDDDGKFVIDFLRSPTIIEIIFCPYCGERLSNAKTNVAQPEAVLPLLAADLWIKKRAAHRPEPDRPGVPVP